MTIRVVLFLRGYTLKRTVRKAGQSDENNGSPEAQAETGTAAKASIAAVGNGSEGVSREGTIEGETPAETEGEKKDNTSPV